jgi:dTDP-4-dehydrorhamnose reductase
VRILVTGAAGMLGRDLVVHLAGRHAVTGIDMEVDIREPGPVRTLVEELRPEAVVHLAAWTDVDGAEADEPAAYAVNATGTAHVAAAARAVGAAMVVVSTDYVFPGTDPRGCAEDDPVSPVGAYGRTKLAGELAAVCTHPGGVRVARTAWLYGAHGRNFVDTMLGLAAERDEVRVVADQVGSPTWTRDLAPALEAVIGLPPGVYHVAGGGAVSWADLARRTFALAGVTCAVADITTAELGRPAPRPAWSALRATRPGAPRLRPWDEALADYLAERGRG